MVQTSLEIRQLFTKYDDIRDAGLTTPAGIRRFDDIQYGSDPAWQKLDVYRPAAATGKLPVIVSFHGGAWAYGDKERYQYYCMELAMHGFAVVNYTYRLTPEYQFPAPLEDTNLVFGWVLEHAEELAEMGVMGFETHHPDMEEEVKQFFDRFCEERGLYKMGGTDHRSVLCGHHPDKRFSPDSGGVTEEDFMKIYHRTLG